MTGQVAQIAFALASRRRREAPRSPSGWKNISEPVSRHAPWYCHSQRSMTGPGSLESSAIGGPSLGGGSLNETSRYNRARGYSRVFRKLLRIVRRLAQSGPCVVQERFSVLLRVAAFVQNRFGGLG